MNKNKFLDSIAMLPAADGVSERLLSALANETDRLLVTGNLRYNRYGLWFDTRYALWEGQNDEGTKDWDDAFPWPGASDTRVRLADSIIRERTRIRKAAFWGKRVQARALRPAVNAGNAVLATTLVKWMLYVEAITMVKRETELGWSYQDTYGVGVMGCFWRQKTRLEPLTLNLREMAEMALQNQDPTLLGVVKAIADPLQEPAVIAGLKQVFPDHGEGELRGIVKKLRRDQPAVIRQRYTCENQPQWLALRPGIDVFFDAALHDLQDAPLIVCRELLGEADVRERESSEDWDPEFIELAVKQAGKTGLDYAMDPLRMSPRGIGGRRMVMAEDMDRRIEILRAFYFVSERKSAGLYQTVFHRNVKGVAAHHGLHDYDHGKMPFHVLRCETVERPILESRGVPEICLTWQAEKKWNRDARADRLSMEILPTLMVPRGYAGEVLLGPGQQVERKRPGDYEYLSVPEMTATAKESPRELEKEVNEYFGRFDPEGDPTAVQVARQELATDTLTDLVPLLEQTWQLMQQYLTDEEIQAVAGELAKGVRLGKQDIQGQYRFEFTFDVRTLDPEFFESLVGVVEKIIPMDRQGQIDLGELVTILFEGISPDIAARVIKSPQSAQMAEVTDELQQLAQIAVGIEPPMKPAGNPQLRLQVIQQAMQSPRFQNVVTSDQTGVTPKLLENQVQKYKFAIEQYVDNAQIGRMGVRPVLGGDGSGLPAPGGQMPEGSGQ